MLAQAATRVSEMLDQERREAYNAYMREWTRKNRDRINAERREKLARIRLDPELREIHNASRRVDYAKHADKRREYYRNYYKNHKELHSQRSSNWKRIHRNDRDRAGTFTTQEWVELCNKYNNRCIACGKQGKLEVDHIVPLSCGGTNTIDNIQPLCRRCNASKSARIIDYRNIEGI